MSYTRFMDMHSGGSQKESAACIYIEAPEEEAKIIFYNRFGHNPDRVTCTCCGPDYSISEHKSLAQATGYDRGCKYDAVANVLIIPASAILPEERVGEVPEQGYVWQD